MSSATDFLLLSKSPELRAKQVAYGRAVDQARQQAENRAALREAMRPTEELPSSRVPSAAEYALNSRIAAANREEKPTGALGVIRRELPRFFKADDELADAMGDFSLRQGATATGGALAGLAAPAYLPMRTALARALTGVPLSVAGGRALDPAAEKVLGTSVSDPLSDAVFGGMAGATGKVVAPLLASLAASSGDAEAGALSALRRRIFSQGDRYDLGDATRNIRQRVVIEEDPKLRENEFNKKALIDQLYRDAEEHKDLYTQAFLDDNGNAVALYQTRRKPGKGTSLNYMVSDQPGLGTEMLEEVYRFAPEKPVTLHALPGTEGFYRRFPEWEEDRSEGVSKFIRKAGGGIVRKALEKFGRRAAHSGDIDASVEAPRGAMSVVKNKGGNWLTGSVEDALSGLKRNVVPPRRTIENDLTGQAVRDFEVAPRAINSFIDKQLTRYVKNEMATPEDPVRALAERGVLHFDPTNEINGVAISKAALNRGNSGNLASGVGESQLAKQWETLGDQAVTPRPASHYQGSYVGQEENPWMMKLAPSTNIYDIPPRGREVEGLGFSHLIDELSNALNPESGLPRHLLLDPKSMDRVSVPQAVERVAQINAWRAAQMAAAKKAALEGAPVFKTYENAPKGLHWRNIAVPGNEEATRTLHKNVGDQMGICVGGEDYCSRAIKGEAQHYTLFDEAGEPHVTVEVASPITPEEAKRAFKKEHGRLPEDEDELFEWADENFATAELPSIKQIKGKQNRAPNEEYLPFVQDFVRSGKWSDVGDLQNTGLYRRSTLTPEEQALTQGDYLTMDEIKKLREGKPWVPIDDTPEFAQGGSVELNNASQGSVRTPAWPTCKCDYKEQAA